ncbi:hypothetical protein [Encephalitozoon cuniculi GB-M1]|uniref:Uncharacterized protein n=2 Tax=Encephalitozoon cuniculi TaxID=6035 RepID=Q8SW63_ENCCU|nr:uncharacterized protein ECU03_0370 [Encephalitozoon cuniculi GB-M1]AGE95955.1 hypothetical protein ECU03_0370 [Encephalitozoon cuniculi]KMV66401.1 hypothetical protein M970_030310 [Encephalitozoon cuniculi EcunIII-L]UYI28027.1 hypothetical protein J0A71_09g19230 [Encephalitozoon cuniculi]CAD26184.1 hypothetical protein [Encephalitozoon cuniculi GB-M1]
MRTALSFLFIRKASCYFLFELIDDFARYYEDMFFPDSTGAWAILAGSFFVTFYGTRFPRICLAPYIAAMIYYKFCGVKQGLDSISPKTIEEYNISPEILQSLKSMFDSDVDDTTSVWIVSFLLASIFVWALEMASNLLFMVGLYIIYRMFFHIGFETYKESSPIVFYILLLVSFGILYYVTRRLAKYLLLVLFSVTGSLVLLASIELVTESYTLGFYDLILDLEDAQYLELSHVSTPMGIWILTALMGVLWQWKFIEDKT